MSPEGRCLSLCRCIFRRKSICMDCFHTFFYTTQPERATLPGKVGILLYHLNFLQEMQPGFHIYTTSSSHFCTVVSSEPSRCPVHPERLGHDAVTVKAVFENNRCCCDARETSLFLTWCSVLLPGANIRWSSVITQQVSRKPSTTQLLQQ